MSVKREGTSPRTARQGSLELDYGDETGDMDYDQWSAAQLAAPAAQETPAPSAPPPKPVAAAPAAAASLPPKPPANGLPANPLTGQRPAIASAGSAAAASTSGGTMGGGSTSAHGGSSGGGYVQGDRLAQTALFLGDLHWVRSPSPLLSDLVKGTGRLT